MSAGDDTDRRIDEWFGSFVWPEDHSISGSLVDALFPNLNTHDKLALIGALALHQAGLDPELETFYAMMSQLPNPPKDWARWMLVREGRDHGLTWEKAYDYAANKLGNRVTAKTMKRSYQEWQKKVRES